MIKLDTSKQPPTDFNINRLIVKANKNILDEPAIEPIKTNSDTHCIQPGLPAQEEHLFEVY